MKQPLTPGLRYKTVAYTLIAFVAGFAVLAVEITGTRLIAGTLGNSIYTWSALIAAILLSMSMGSLGGGMLIDRSLKVKWLLVTLVVAAVSTALAPAIAGIAQGSAASMQLTEGALFECGLIFTIPALAYGAIPPQCVKLLSAAGDGKQVGFSTGIVSMAGSLGSFAGALATPFWLIPNLSLTSIFFSLACLVVLSGLLLAKVAPLSRQATAVLSVIAAAMLVLTIGNRKSAALPPFIFDQNTSYHRIRVQEQMEGGEKARYLVLDTTLEGGIVANTDTLPLEYQNTWELVKKAGIPVRHVLCIGAGAFGVPERLSAAYPDATIDVAEIDPMVIKTGRDYFDTGRFPNVRPVAMDGRVFLSRSAATYDFIFIDAYHGLRYIPPHLTTVEFFRLCQQHLSPHGIVMMNVISPVMGPNGDLFRAFATTVKSVFPYCGAIPLEPMRVRDLQNVVLVCSANPLPREENDHLMNVADLPLQDARAMVDAKNPIEAILARQLRIKE